MWIIPYFLCCINIQIIFLHLYCLSKYKNPIRYIHYIFISLNMSGLSVPWFILILSLSILSIIIVIWLIWGIKIWNFPLKNTTFIKKILTCLFYYGISTVLSTLLFIFFMTLAISTIVPFTMPAIWWPSIDLLVIILPIIGIWCWLSYMITMKTLRKFPKYIHWFGIFFALCIIIPMSWLYTVIQIDECNWSKYARAPHSTFCTLLVWPQVR